ncbi:hypothetical protein V8F06_001968 [Rhypophila decipiens]
MLSLIAPLLHLGASLKPHIPLFVNFTLIPQCVFIYLGYFYIYTDERYLPASSFLSVRVLYYLAYTSSVLGCLLYITGSIRSFDTDLLCG